jgi:hypothetical protein
MREKINFLSTIEGLLCTISRPSDAYSFPPHINPVRAKIIIAIFLTFLDEEISVIRG